MSRESVDLVRRDQACVGPDVSRLRRRSPCFCDGLEDNAQSSVYREWLARGLVPSIVELVGILIRTESVGSPALGTMGSLASGLQLSE